MNNKKNESFTFRDVLWRIGYFALCGLIVLAVYTVFMLFLYTFIRGTFWGDATISDALPSHFWFIGYTLAYGLPLYFVYFLKNNEYRTYLLHITEDEFRWKTIFKEFTLSRGKYDIIVFAGYSLLLFLPFSDVFSNPAILISIQQAYFFLLPVPRIISYIMAVLFFTAQYYVCFWFAVIKWDKTRLHSNRK
ncbi:MAG: hypothetical protein E7662_02975 [Ruminococcaceae bacterium]|nr:hypothetical protein [Oscillospiraceae bacterium]